jgi:hypothetical protein
MALGERVPSGSEKRKAQRVRIYAPLHAEVDATRVMVVDLSSAGARIEHSFALPVGRDVVFRLTAGEQSVTLRATVIRCRLDRSVSRDAIVYNSGLSFPPEHDPDLDNLHRIIRELVNYDLDARKTYARKKR